jgi:hypothetical protein
MPIVWVHAFGKLVLAEMMAALEKLAEPTMRGDPESPFRWTYKSLRHVLIHSA